MKQDPANHDTTLNYYEGNARKYFNSTVKLNMASLYPPFLAYMPPYAAILDAGCGSGRDTLYFAQRGYRVTAFDYSSSLVNLASKLTGQGVLHLSFQELEFDETFHGVWACSSLMHVPRAEWHEVITRLSNAMQVDGVLYASFKYGTGEHLRDGRFFVDLDEKNLEELIGGHPELSLVRHWKTSDVKAGREGEQWLNLLIRKTKPQVK